MGFRDPDISAIAKVFADPARATIVIALLDGDGHQAGELAARARVAPSTASSHLRLLLNAGVVSVRREGTRRTYSIEDGRMRHAVEALASIAPDAASRNPSLTRSLRIRRLSYARRCYDHIGGAFAMRLVNDLKKAGAVKVVDGGFLLRPTARATFTRLGVDADEVLDGSPFVRGCEDWTEGQAHFGGPLAAALYQALLQRCLIAADTHHRILTVAPAAEELISTAIKIEAC